MDQDGSEQIVQRNHDCGHSHDFIRLRILCCGEFCWQEWYNNGGVREVPRKKLSVFVECFSTLHINSAMKSRPVQHAGTHGIVSSQTEHTQHQAYAMRRDEKKVKKAKKAEKVEKCEDHVPTTFCFLRIVCVLRDFAAVLCNLLAARIIWPPGQIGGSNGIETPAAQEAAGAVSVRSLGQLVYSSSGHEAALKSYLALGQSRAHCLPQDACEAGRNTCSITGQHFLERLHIFRCKFYR